jgi:putative nucleotidyltransferase with HDIG domain
MKLARRTLFAAWLSNSRKATVLRYARYSLVGLGAWLVLTTALSAPISAEFVLGRALAVGAFCAVAIGVVVSHLLRQGHSGSRIKRRLRVMFTVALLTILGIQIARYALLSASDDPGLMLLVPAPVTAAGLLLGALLAPGPTSVALALLALCCWVSGLAEGPTLIAAWFAGAVGAHAVNPLKQRSDLIRSGVLVIAAYAVLGAGAVATARPITLEMVQVAGWGVIAGIGAMALFWLSVAVFERAFDIVSDWGLLELCSPDQKLLHELTLRAPGTWAHSVMVGNLAEAAARAVGANPVLARAASYYHDIGKMVRPEFFVENQGATNIHDTMSPNLSARVISAHVKDGLRMAEEHRLPQVIKSAIAEHHGTSLIAYFYRRATEGSEQKDPVLEQHFRYEGPKPQRKEVGILMLADTVEAATRTIEITSPSRLENLVSTLVREKFEDGQLDECELTFRDVKRIVDAFVQSLTAVRHHRIDYGPAAEQEEIDEQQSDADQEAEVPPQVAAN